MAAGQFEQVHDRIWRVPSDFSSSGVATATNVYVVRGAVTARDWRRGVIATSRPE